MSCADTSRLRSARRSRSAAAFAALAGLVSGALYVPQALAGTPTARAATHFACSGPKSPKQPCYFSTPSGNVHCLWTPKLNAVECELLASGRAYRLNPSGKAKTLHVKLSKRGETLPTSQDIVFPESLSCRDTKTTITCNQDFGLGSFKLAPKGSHST
jgi:hypothetical protein